MYIYKEDQLFSNFTVDRIDSATKYNVRVAYIPNDARYLNARVSCYQLYNYALSAKEIAANMYRCQDSGMFAF